MQTYGLSVNHNAPYGYFLATGRAALFSLMLVGMSSRFAHIFRHATLFVYGFRTHRDACVCAF